MKKTNREIIEKAIRWKKEQDSLRETTGIDKMIGLKCVKDQLVKIIFSNAFERVRTGGKQNLTPLHMAFLGNPGTGKTEVARYVAQILHTSGVLPSNRLVERKAGDLIGKYIGHTAPKVTAACEEAQGGVLFIDEAYVLEKTRDFGPEAAAQLLQHMENERGRFIVILAGYPNDMGKLIKLNPGFKSRIPYYIDFPDYSSEELKQIMLVMAKTKHLTMEPRALDMAINYVLQLKAKDPENFANARDVRNTLQGIIDVQTKRLIGSNTTVAASLAKLQEFNKTGKIFGVNEQTISVLTVADVEAFLRESLRSKLGHTSHLTSRNLQ